MLVYLVFSLCCLILIHHKPQHTILFLSVIVYQSCILNSSLLGMNTNMYVFLSTVQVMIVVGCIYDYRKDGFDWMWVVEIVPLVTIKVLELLFIVSPDKFYIDWIGSDYFSLDGYFVGGILFTMYCREVGYNPFKYNFKRFRKYLLSILVSFIFLINYI